MELEVPIRPIFTPTLSIVMVRQLLQWERQKKFFDCNVRDHDKEILVIYIYIYTHTFAYLRGKNGRRRGEGKHEENSQNCPFWTYIKIISTSTF